MINRCSVCKSVIQKGEAYYEAEPNCIMPDDIPVNQYTQSLMSERLGDYVAIKICMKCIQRAKETAPCQSKPKASEKEVFSKPKPRRLNNGGVGTREETT